MQALEINSIKNAIRSIPDFPKPGILFRDITPLLVDPQKFKSCIDFFVRHTPEKIDTVISIESRGFILGSALAYALKAGFVPIRKAGKLPHATLKSSYNLEYGQAVIEIHADAIAKGANILLVDDVLATGGTAEAAIGLVKKFGARICGVYFLIELTDLKGRERLSGHPVQSLVSF